MIEFIIDREYENVKIDRYLRKFIKEMSLSEIYKNIRKGKIKVNNKKVKHDYRLQLEDKINVYAISESLPTKNYSFLDLTKDRKLSLSQSIVFENENLFIINKEAGDVLHVGSGHDFALLDEYRSFFQNENINFVNRIDKSTSGLVIGAKNIRTARELAEEIRENRVIKKYYILVKGEIKKSEFIIENYLKKDEKKVIVSSVKKEGFKKSLTYFKTISSSVKYTILEALLVTGRTHQLRVQLADINHPIVGDEKYGDDDENKMYLFSHYLKIPLYDIEINLAVPNFYFNKLL